MTEGKRMSLVKPTVQTPFHIDFAWWSKNDRDWRVYLWNVLCPEHQKIFANMNAGDEVDWVDSETAEVQRVDGLQHVLITHCAKQPGFFDEHTALVDSVFKVFLANGNTPMTPLELAEKLGRQPATILNTLAGGQVFKGLRPLLD